MKKHFTRVIAALALLVFMMPSMKAWATDVTFNYSDYTGQGGPSGSGSEYTMVKTDVSISDTKFYGNTSFVNLYAGGVSTITPSSGVTITKIVLTASSTSYNGFQSSGTVTPSTGSVSANGTAVTWTGSADAAFTISHNKQIRWTSIVVTYSTSGSSTTPTTVTIDDTNLTNTDVYAGTAAGSLSATVTAGGSAVSGATVTWTSSDTGVATIDASGVVSLVAAGATTITASYAGNETYESSSNTYSLTVTDSTPFDGVIFDATEDTGTSSITKDNVTLACDNGVLNNGSEYRLYKNSTTTISITGGNKITKIEFIGTSSNPASGFGSQTGWSTSGYNGVWEGEAESVSFVASGAQVRATMIKVTVLEITTPSISADNVSIAYDATSGEIAYTLNNPATNGNLSVSENVDWISNPVLSTTESKVTFTTTANQATTSREGIVTITYTYGNNETVSKDVTVTQAAAPVSYTTIPDMFAAATTTETNVLVTFNNWVVSGVSSNGKNVFVTDNNGNGFVIFYTTDMSSTFAAGNILSGTAVSCSLKKYNGFAELLNVTATDLTITSGGTVTAANVAMADLAGVNTGALVHYESLTCSVNNNKYYLSDGTTTLQVYGGIYDFGTLVEGKTYNITGVYQQYNNTKEILPRSAADIEEVEVQHEEYTLTVSNLSHVNLFIFGGEESETIISTEDGQSTAQVYDGTEVLVSIDVETGYVFQSLTITNASGTPIEPEELTANEYYKFTMPTSNVTISATAEVLTGDNYELYSGALVEGDYLIVYNGKAMNNTINSNRLQYVEVTASNDVITTDNAEIVWHIAPSGDYWTIFSADANAYAASTGNKNQATTMTNGTDNKALWTVSDNYDFVNKYNSDNNINSYLRNNGTYGFACYGTSTGGALSLYKKVEATPTPQNFTLDIDQYTSGQNGWYLIASPVSVDLSTNTMVSGTYDLYRFNPTADLEWENYKNENHSDFTTLEVGRGYLYANGNNGGIQLSFTGTPANNGEVTAAYTGWNLVGNPLSTAATVDRDYYRMNDTHTGIMTDAGNGNIAMMEGVFVEATANETITFSSASKSSNRASVVMNLSQNRGGVIDRAIVRFNDDSQLSKFQLFENSTKLCIAQNGEEFAIASAEAQGEMPVNFKAASNGTYTISINTENVEMNYLHLIDNLTGNDVDLLATPSYTFNAKTDDYASRFRLVFSAGNTDSDNFAFVSDGQIIVNGQGTVQVYDITGRMIGSHNDVTSITTDGMTAGVYMIRLVNGNTIKTQKIVVK